MNKFIVIGEFETELDLAAALSLITKSIGPDLTCVKIDDINAEMNYLEVYYDGSEFCFENNITISDKLWDLIANNGICTGLKINFPAIRKYGVPIEATDLGGQAFAAQWFSVISKFEVMPIDTRDDSATSYTFSIDVPKFVFDEYRKVTNASRQD